MAGPGRRSERASLTLTYTEETAVKTEKIKLTIATTGGSWTHDFAPDETLETVVRKALKHLELEGPGPWILSHDGVLLDQQKTIEEARLRDGAALVLNQEEGGGGSGRQ